mmetsp:Transcript_11210/g.26949  ORF Transcript_11210/g.26949 Transcript_11210/m.26949 type:complete len:138 (+) Transcript_11210:48-461(+)
MKFQKDVQLATHFNSLVLLNTTPASSVYSTCWVRSVQYRFVVDSKLLLELVNLLLLESLRQRRQLVREKSCDGWDFQQTVGPKFPNKHKKQDQKGKPSLADTSTFHSTCIVNGPSHCFYVFSKTVSIRNAEDRSKDV